MAGVKNSVILYIYIYFVTWRSLRSVFFCLSRVSICVFMDFFFSDTLNTMLILLHFHFNPLTKRLPLLIDCRWNIHGNIIRHHSLDNATSYRDLMYCNLSVKMQMGHIVPTEILQPTQFWMIYVSHIWLRKICTTSHPHIQDYKRKLLLKEIQGNQLSSQKNTIIHRILNVLISQRASRISMYLGNLS